MEYGNYFKEAFQKLNLLEQDFDITADVGKVDELKSFVADDKEAVIEEPVYDVKAENEEELEDEYIGKVILECECCHSKFYKDPDEVIIDPETSLANIEEECPLCNSSSGYTVIGKIEPFNMEEPTEEEVEVEVEEEEPIEVEEEVRESLGARARKHLSEACNSEDDENIEESVSDLEKLDTFLGINESLTEAVNYTGNYKYPYLVSYGSESQMFSTIQEVIDQLEIYINDDCFPIQVKKFRDKQDFYAEWFTIETPEVGRKYITKLSQLTNESLTEAVNNLSLDTDDTHLEMTADETGKVTVTTEPLVENEEFTEEPTEEDGGEVVLDTNVEEIVPLEQEDIAEIEANSEEEQTEEEVSEEEPVGDEEEVSEEEPAEGEEDLEFDEFDEESFDEMGESYLRKVYDNVKSYKTTSLTESNNVLSIRGEITFTSGKTAPTNFIFNEARYLKNNKVVLEGYNNTFSKTKKAFSLKGNIDNKKFISESLGYHYIAKNLNESVKVNGRIKKIVL